MDLVGCPSVDELANNRAAIVKDTNVTTAFTVDSTSDNQAQQAYRTSVESGDRTVGKIKLSICMLRGYLADITRAVRNAGRVDDNTRVLRVWCELVLRFYNTPESEAYKILSAVSEHLCTAIATGSHADAVMWSNTLDAYFFVADETPGIDWFKQKCTDSPHHVTVDDVYAQTHVQHIAQTTQIYPRVYTPKRNFCLGEMELA